MGKQAALKKVQAVTTRLAATESQRDAAVAIAVDAGCTWAQIGEALGVSAQAAHKRFRWIRHSPTTGEVWSEPPLPV
jgi:hypothetical protein